MSEIQTQSVMAAEPKAQKIIERLQSSGEKTVEFFAQITPDQWEAPVYAEGADWTVHHVLGHFVASEASIVRLIKYILQGLPGVPEGFDIDKHNQREVGCFMKITPQAVLVRFQETRQETIEMVAQLSAADLATEGRHPWLGVTPIEEMIKLMYRHNQIHQRDIRKTLNL